MTHEHEPGSERCTEVFERLSEYIDGELSPAKYQQVCGHMEHCAPCLKFVETLRRTVDYVQGVESPVPREEVGRTVREAWATLRDELERES